MDLISTNVNPTDSRIETLFSGLDVQEIKTYDVFCSKDQATYLNSLNNIKVGNGYFVKMNSNGTLAVNGLSVKTPTLPIFKTGWNLIECNFQNAQLISNLFSATNLVIIKDFDGFWIPNGTMNSLINYEPGKGYFLKK